MREADDLCSRPRLPRRRWPLRPPGQSTLSRAREAAARLVGAGPDDVALTQNTTHGMNLGVASIDWREGDEVDLGHDGAPRLPRAAPQPEEAFRGKRSNSCPPPVTPEKIEASLTPKTRLVALSHVDWTNGRGTAAAGDLHPGPRAGSPYPRRRRPVGREHRGRRAGHRRRHVRLHRPQVGARSRGHGRVLRQAGPASLQPERRLLVAARSRRTSTSKGTTNSRPDARRFEASTMSPALAAGFAAAAGAVHERGSAGFEEIRRRADLLMDLLSGTTARHHPFAETRALRARQLRGRRRRRARRRRTPARAGFHPALHARSELLRQGEHAPVQYRG